MGVLPTPDGGYVPPRPPTHVPAPSTTPTSSQLAEYYNSLNSAYNEANQVAQANGVYNLGGNDWASPTSGYNQALGYAQANGLSLFQQPSAPQWQGPGGGGGWGYGGGGGGMSAEQKASAESIAAYYQQLMGGSDDYAPLLQRMRKDAKQNVRSVRKAGKRAQRVNRRQAQGMRQDLAAFENPYAGVSAARHGIGDRSAALLADQGAVEPNGAVSRAVQEMSSTSRGNNAAFNQMARLLQSNERSNQQGRISDVRMGAGARRNAITDQMLGLRLGIRNQFQDGRTGIMAQQIADRQRYRDAMIQVLMSAGLPIPEELMD